MTGGSWRGRRLRHAASACSALGVVVAAACYSSVNGTAPPPNTFYYPIGLAVSASGNVLYAANSDFDLQFNAGTVQSYDLTQLRIDAVRLMLGLYTGAPAFDAGVTDAGEGVPSDAGSLPFSAPSDAACPYTQLYPPPTNPNLPNDGIGFSGRLPIGQACAPPMNSQTYYKDSVLIGAFATDIQMSRNKDRLFVPVRGSATIAWIDVKHDDDADAGAPAGATGRTFAPFDLSGKNQCGAGVATNPCDKAHNAGTLNDPGNTRQLSMPGEPFAMALSDDGTAIALTHQAALQISSTQTVGVTSLYLSGLVPGNTTPNSATNFSPSLQFIVENLPFGGDGIVAVPHDPAALTNPDPSNPLRPAFLETFNQAAEVDLLRYYTDEGYQSSQSPEAGAALADAGVAVTVGSSNLRPFLMKERAYPVTSNAGGNNNRGIAIDPTPRIACEQNALAQGLLVTSPEYVACAQTPARVFIASRTPPSLILGQVGGMSGEGSTYDPDQLILYGNVPLSAGPSNVYVAPIVDQNGNYAVRVFVVCFDSQTIAIWDPDAQRIENVIETGPGPFAMAFDPFDITDVAMHKHVAPDARSQLVRISHGAAAGPALLKYRFAYLTSFTDSYVQMLDLDGSFQDDRLDGVSAFETMVYTLGVPTVPVSSN